MSIMRFTNEHTQSVFEENNFDAFKKLMFDTAKGQLNSVTASEANDKIREIFNQVLGLDEGCTTKEYRRAIRRHAIDVYEVIEDVIPDMLKTGWGDNPFFNQFVEYKNLSDGDTNEFYTEDDSVLTVSKLSGNHHDIIRQRLGEGESYQVKTSWYGVKFYADFERFMTGHVDWAKMVTKLYEAFDKLMNTMIYDALIKATTQVLPAKMFQKTGTLDATKMPDVLSLVQDIETATGETVTIVGTRTSLNKLTSISKADWSDGMRNERNSLGRLGVWEGISMAEIKQGFKSKDLEAADVKLVPDNMLLFLPSGDNKFIKVVDEGDAQVYENNDSSVNMDMTIDYEYQQKMGVATQVNKKFGVWQNC